MGMSSIICLMPWQEIGVRLVEVVVCGEMVWKGELTKVGVVVCVQSA